MPRSRAASFAMKDLPDADGPTNHTAVGFRCRVAIPKPAFLSAARISWTWKERRKSDLRVPGSSYPKSSHTLGPLGKVRRRKLCFTNTTKPKRNKMKTHSRLGFESFIHHCPLKPPKDEAAQVPGMPLVSHVLHHDSSWALHGPPCKLDPLERGGHVTCAQAVSLFLSIRIW